jgi:hypothetical protein
MRTGDHIQLRLATPPTDSLILVNGQEISGVQSLEITASAHLTRLTLHIGWPEPQVISGYFVTEEDWRKLHSEV